MDKSPARKEHPGRAIQRFLDQYDETIHWLARECRLPVKDVANVISGVWDITPTLATGLADAFGTSESFWLSLQEAYDSFEEKV